MRITPVASQPNFCAKLRNNDTVKEFMQLATTDQLKEFRKGLEELDKYNKKDIIEITRNETNDGYKATNLTNKKTISFKNYRVPTKVEDTYFPDDFPKVTSGYDVKFSFLDTLNLSKNSETLFGDLKSQYMNSINSMLQKGTTPKASKTKVDAKA